MVDKASEKNVTIFGEVLEEKQQEIILDFETGGEQIDKILSAKATARIGIAMQNEEKTLAEGDVVIDVIYLTSDGLVQTGTTEGKFSVELEPDQPRTNRVYNVDVSVSNIETVDVFGTGAKFNVTLKVQPSYLQEEEIEAFFSEDENIKQKVLSCRKTKLIAKGERCIEQTGESAEITGLIKVLNSSANALLGTSKTGNGYVRFDGETDVFLALAKEENESTTFQNIKITLPFSEELELENVAEGMDAFAYVCVKNLKAFILEEGDVKKAGVSFDLCLKAQVFENQSFEGVCDIYGTKNIVMPHAKSYKYQKFCKTVYSTNRFEGNVVMDNETDRVDKILFHTVGCTSISNRYIDNQRAYVSGVTYVTVIYFNDETEKICSLVAKLPFETETQLQFDAGEDAITFANADLIDVEVSVRRGREIFVDGKIVTCLRLAENDVDATICSAEVGEELNQKTGAIRVYFAKQGQTIWEISKDLHVDENVVRSQNIFESETLEEDKKVVIYTQKTC